MAALDNIRSRLFAGTIYVASSLVFFYFGGIYLKIALTLAAGVCLFEVLTQLKLKRFALLFIPLIAYLNFIQGEQQFFRILIAVFFFSPFLIYYGMKATARILARIGVFAMLFFFIACGSRFAFEVRSQMNMIPAFFILFSCWIYDNGAYFTGAFLGKRKIFGELSPKKTLEGVLGGLLCNLIFGVLWSLIFYGGIRAALYWSVFAMTVGIISQLGDLYISFFKRYIKIKDFSGLLGGHGGLLDRLDSIYFTFPLVYIIFGL